MCVYDSLGVGVQKSGAPKHVAVYGLAYVTTQLGGESAVKYSDVRQMALVGAFFCPHEDCETSRMFYNINGFMPTPHEPHVHFQFVQIYTFV